MTIFNESLHFGETNNGQNKWSTLFLRSDKLDELLILTFNPAMFPKWNMFFRKLQINKWQKQQSILFSPAYSRVIRENVAGNAQLSKLSEKAIELIDANDVLIRESKQLIRENGILEENEKELTIRNMSSLKVLEIQTLTMARQGEMIKPGNSIINMLTVKCKQQQKVISDIEKNVSQTKNTEISNNFLKQDCANIKIKLDDVIKNNKMLRKQQNELKRVNNLQKNENNDLINILKVTVNQLKFVFSSSNSHNDVESDYKDDPEADSIEKHNALLVTILYILKKANDHNVGINIEDLSNKLLHSEQISTLKQTQPDTKILVKKDKICHYKLGDLGLVPDRLDQRTISSRLSQLSDTVKFKLHVAKSKSIGIQTEHLKNHEMYNNIAKNNTSGTSKSKQYTLVQFKNFLQNL
ncbi:hypothetical protein A3Q56_05859 [Intoshia linei]|uniref:Cilia- and flagella-associated protein 157 n=1 Tax=Intoshia linei TaxID=1819745 RepID=A0A177AWL9_9BILA|nr:hypothetical protein A3Q56_05859 [Intoshia linei]